MARHIRSSDLNLDKKACKKLRQRIRKIKDRKIVDRLRVVLYKAEGHSHKDIASLLQIGINQVTKILKRYLDGGIEAQIAPFMALRFGVQTKPDRVMGGLGFNYGGVHFDYALINHSVLPATHQFAISYRFGRD